ncbi:hypothetical protein BU17DRAFT_96885 [Hysterangium stoloniferum]|nr:hypothetical protein BU17DRAFT_96885 [Hysterangium stoloniferum]
MAALAILFTAVGCYIAWASILSNTPFHKFWSLIQLLFLFLIHALYDLPISAYNIPLYILAFAIFVLCVALSPAQVFIFRPEPPDQQRNKITVLSNGHPDHTTVVDIVAVHGLASNPATTWGSFKPPQSPGVPDSTVTGHDPPSNQKVPKRSWLCDLAEDIPNARIMTFNHNTAWQANALNKSLNDHADDLLRSLDLKREAPEEKARPIIFIGHSFGGLIIKQAMVNANLDLQHSNICKQALGFIFLGTPHKGAELAWGARFISLFGFWNGSSTTLLEALELGSPNNQTMHSQFVKFLVNGPYMPTYTLCVFEAVKESFCGMPFMQVVTSDSAVIDGSTKIGFERRHREIQRLSRDDEDYKVIVLSMKKWVQEVVERIRKQQDKIAQEKTQDQEECLRSLSFPLMNQRRHDIETKHDTWILKHETYKQWLGRRQGFLWIKGNPGAGKSTVLKDASGDVEAARHDEVVASFFFFRHGDPTQNSLISFFRSLLHQILDKDLPALEKLTERHRKKRATQYGAGKEVQWHEAELMVFLETIIPAARPIRIYVDALDEVGETDASRLLKYFRGLTVHDNLSICFSCRHNFVFGPEVGVVGPEVLTICVENENNEDLETYVRKELEDGIVGDNELIQELTMQITGKATGIFLWVTLVVPKITIAHAEGNSSKYLKQMVQELLEGLNEYYKDMVKCIKHRKESLRLMGWICFAKRPLSLADLRDFMAVDPDSSYTSFKQCQDSPHYLETDDQMKKKVKSLSEGLAEVKEQNKQLVAQFIHQSVQDYLVKSDGFQILENPNTTSNTTGETTSSRRHLDIAKTCLKFISMEDVVKRG